MCKFSVSRREPEQGRVEEGDDLPDADAGQLFGVQLQELLLPDPEGEGGVCTHLSLEGTPADQLLHPGDLLLRRRQREVRVLPLQPGELQGDHRGVLPVHHR